MIEYSHAAKRNSGTGRRDGFSTRRNQSFTQSFSKVVKGIYWQPFIAVAAQELSGR